MTTDDRGRPTGGLMRDDAVADVPPDPPNAAGTENAGTGLRRHDESDPYGRELKGAGDVVHSDTVGAAELSSEYTAGHAATDSRSDLDEVDEAWSEAEHDSVERPPGEPRG